MSAYRHLATYKSCALLTTSMLALGQPAFAQQVDQPASEAPVPGEDGDIIVTATKVATPLSRVPISVSAYSQETLDVKSIREVRSLAAQTPGIDLAESTTTSGGYRLAIRGIDSNAGAATTATYIDETPIQSRNSALNYSGNTFPQIFDLDRVEVLRGPQGTLFGASAQGGALRFITPTPSLTKTSGYGRALVSATAHGGFNYDVGLAAGGPIVEDKLGLRVSVNRKQLSGYVDRVSWQAPENRNKDGNDDKSWIARAALLWQPVEGVTITPAIYYQKRDIGDTSFFWAEKSDLGEHRFVNGNAGSNDYHDRFVLPSLKISADIGAVNLTSVTAYYDRDARENRDLTNSNDRLEYGAAPITPPGTTNRFIGEFPVLPGTRELFSTMRAHTTQRDITQELRLSNSNPEARLKWQVGVYFSQGTLRSTPMLEARHHTALYKYVTGVDIVTGKGSDNIGGIYNYIGNERTRERSIAGFANLDYELLDKLTVTVGGRISKDQVDFNVVERGPDYGVVGQVAASGRLRTSPFTPKIALTWRPDRSNMVYASYAEGYRTGGVNKGVANTCLNDVAELGVSNIRTYQPDRTKSYELGSKNKLFGGAVRLEGSVYVIKWENIQQQVRPPCGFSLVINSGKATSRGFDLNVDVMPTKGLNLTAAVGYNRSTYDDTVQIDKPGTVPIVVARQRLGSTPWTVNTAAEYSFLAGGHDAFIRAQYTYRAPNTGPFNWQIPAYGTRTYDPTRLTDQAIHQVDLRAGYSFSAFDIQVFAENLFDAAPRLGYAPPYVNPTYRSGIHYVRTIRPRTIGLMATTRF